MHKNILVIGGTRHVGKLLVQKLLDAGHRVTLATRGRTADGFGQRVQRIVVDRRDHAAMRAAFGSASYDIVYDQLCYSPVDAAIAIEVFAGKVGRYVMASSIEVYRRLMGRQEDAFEELDLDLAAQAIDMDYPWHDPMLADESYAEGKRQAEALLYRDGRLPLVTVRLGHVLGGDDSTGRLAYYVALAQSGQALLYANAKAATSFISADQASDFLAWSGTQDFLGPVNAADGGSLSALDLHRRVGLVLGEKVRALPLTTQAGLSPFDFPFPYVMDTARAACLGYRFGDTANWLDLAIHQLQPELVCGSPASTAYTQTPVPEKVRQPAFIA
ncbi:NAD-dependent epimerase/dehydratase family protein [Pseudoduganella sp. LjRoot289]|uniref:NAD-dependent epimerase/dehydratase family protein n=1 Tax=Pseudoduganella sp. LjRoot289 TaxID=3342314 RepID=UPI003ECD5514